MTSSPDLDQMTPEKLSALAAQLLTQVDALREAVLIAATRLLTKRQCARLAVVVFQPT